jgi:hypothetical protein
MDAKKEFYQMHGYQPSWIEYVQKLSEADGLETWSERPNPPLPKLKPITPLEKKPLYKTVISILTP